MSSSEKQVVRAGCSRGGIGHALALEFASRNCFVVATGRSLSSMSDLQNNPSFFLQQLDVSSDDSVNRALSTVINEKFGHVNIVVNNAGMPCTRPLAEVPLSAFEKTFNTNVYGSLRLIQGVVPSMISRKKGKIVNVGSVVVLAPTPWGGTYAASKAALHAITDTLRLEVRAFGIDVINVVPGAVKSNIANASLAAQNSMPEWKLYKPFLEAIRARPNHNQSPKATPLQDFAKKTVHALLKENPPTWIGYLSTQMAVLYHMPIFIKDFIMRMIKIKSWTWIKANNKNFDYSFNDWFSSPYVILLYVLALEVRKLCCFDCIERGWLKLAPLVLPF